MASTNPFTPDTANTKTLAATSTSASVTLATPDVSSNVLRIVNLGPNTAFLRWGVGAQTALTTDMPMLSGTVEVFSKSTTADTVAAICAGGNSATIYITAGEGQ